MKDPANDSCQKTSYKMKEFDGEYADIGELRENARECKIKTPTNDVSKQCKQIRERASVDPFELRVGESRARKTWLVLQRRRLVV